MTMLEREIDQRVYRIHELSPEEIAVVEWATPISTEQKIINEGNDRYIPYTSHRKSA
jgi:hypothetical protein